MRLLVVYVNISYLVVTLHKNEQATDLYDNRRMDENAFKLRSLALSLWLSLDAKVGVCGSATI